MTEIIRYETWSPRYREVKYPVIRCGCKKEVHCTSFTNTCPCGADYNMSGQRLAARSQWGEETGETAADILNCDYENFNWDADYY